MRELADLGKGSADRLLRDTKAKRILSTHCRVGEPERHRQSRQPLLSSIVEISLEATALLVSHLDDPRARCAELSELRQQLGFQALMIERQARRSAELLDHARIFK